MSALLRIPPILGPVSGDGLARLLASDACREPEINLWELVRDE